VHAVLLLEQIRHGQRSSATSVAARPLRQEMSTSPGTSTTSICYGSCAPATRPTAAGAPAHRTSPRRVRTPGRPEGELRALESVATHLDDVAGGVRDRLFVDDRQPKVLVVHGRNVSAREAVARFLMKLGLRPILLDEQAGHGRTLIEKLEGHAPASFAVVLLTGDDVGALASDRRHLRPRARQNVIFELAFSIAHLGRERVCALYEEGVELPSDSAASSISRSTAAAPGNRSSP